jgi:hypothetical protein
MEIEKKIWIKYFDAILSGKKTFELRLDDYQYKEGDVLNLREWDPEKKSYTGRSIKKEITYVLHTKNVNFWDKKEIDEKGFVVLSFK